MGIPLLLIALVLFFSACSDNDSGSKSVYLNLPSTTRGSFGRFMYAGRSTPVKMQSKARTVRAIIIKREGSIGEKVSLFLSVYFTF